MKILQINTVPNRNLYSHLQVLIYGLGEDNEIYEWKPVEFSEPIETSGSVFGRNYPTKWAWVRINKQQDNDTTQ